MDIQETVARRIHVIEKVVIRLADETSPINCDWEELPMEFKGIYLKDAAQIHKAYIEAINGTENPYNYYINVVKPKELISNRQRIAFEECRQRIIFKMGGVSNHE